MRLNQAIEKRVLKAAEYIAQHGATVRQTARVFGVSKSTVHKDMETRLPQLSSALAKEVAMVFARNKAERHLRGGEATRNKYKKK
ncbi:MAG: sporulation transcriptional regulator SpoIIID [Clostridiales bacterium]|nr:sporulation transcriptional regulator SpoIIID [Clostridiales bacterium]